MVKFFEEGDRGEPEPPRSPGRYLAVNGTVFVVLVVGVIAGMVFLAGLAMLLTLAVQDLSLIHI